ncbi:MAG: hypothetical protein LBK75_09130 [Oscillospiraceae bacterium]|jgi:hypothetical protein|nr:hypothetical protein [Oscillospiraceae bacterium]
MKTKSRAYALALAAVLAFSVFAISASAQVGQYANTAPLDENDDPVYFYSASTGNAAPHGNNVVDSYDVDLDDDTATIYFKLGHVTVTRPGVGVVFDDDVIVEGFTVDGGSVDFNVNQTTGVGTAVIYDLSDYFETVGGVTVARIPVTVAFYYPGEDDHPGGQDFILQLNTIPAAE